MLSAQWPAYLSCSLITSYYYLCIAEGHWDVCFVGLQRLVLRRCHEPAILKRPHPQTPIGALLLPFPSLGQALGGLWIKNVWSHDFSAAQSGIHLCTQLRAPMWAEKRIFFFHTEMNIVTKSRGLGKIPKGALWLPGTGYSVRPGSMLPMGALYPCISIPKDVIFKIILVIKSKSLTLRTRGKAFSPVSGEDVLSCVSPLTPTADGNSTLGFLSYSPFCSLLSPSLNLQMGTRKTVSTEPTESHFLFPQNPPEEF